MIGGAGFIHTPNPVSLKPAAAQGGIFTEQKFRSNGTASNAPLPTVPLV
jgi:hypothetical protein